MSKYGTFYINPATPIFFIFNLETKVHRFQDFDYVHIYSVLEYSGYRLLKIALIFGQHLVNVLFCLQHDRGRKYEVDEKTREEITSLIAHHVTAVNYIYRNTKFDGRTEHRNIRFEVSTQTPTHPHTHSGDPRRTNRDDEIRTKRPGPASQSP